jgi:hypothetical protein
MSNQKDLFAMTLMVTGCARHPETANQQPVLNMTNSSGGMEVTLKCSATDVQLLAEI